MSVYLVVDASDVVVDFVVVEEDVWGKGKKWISLAFWGEFLMAALNRWTPLAGSFVVVVVVVVVEGSVSFWQSWSSSSAPFGQFLMPSQTSAWLMQNKVPNGWMNELMNKELMKEWMDEWMKIEKIRFIQNVYGRTLKKLDRSMIKT